MARLRTKYDRAADRVREAQETLSDAKAQYEAAKAQYEAAKRALDDAVAEHKAVGEEIDAALEQAERPVAPVTPLPVAAPVVVEPEPKTRTPLNVPPNLLALLAAFSETGATKTSELRDALGLDATVVNTRLQKAKKLGLLESAGWGLFQLTEAGRNARGKRLQIVS